ncbi:MAG: gluconate 2-dehydrogenase subunit 3 family protein [Bryobacteraceae bacterium]
MMDDLKRRELFKLAAGAAFLTQIGPAVHADTVGAGPRFFTKEEFDLVDELSDMIIPTDDHSPGAKAAGVASYIDARLAEAWKGEHQEEWRNGLKLIDSASHKKNGKPFLDATPEQRMAILESFAKNEKHPKTPEEKFFGALKEATVYAYYTSDIGIHKDMDYKGNTMLKEFVGYAL